MVSTSGYKMWPLSVVCTCGEHRIWGGNTRAFVCEAIGTKRGPPPSSIIEWRESRATVHATHWQARAWINIIYPTYPRIELRHNPLQVLGPQHKLQIHEFEVRQRGVIFNMRHGGRVEAAGCIKLYKKKSTVSSIHSVGRALSRAFHGKESSLLLL
jgi:hypothetical protein